MGLGEHLRTGEPADPQAAAAWLGSADGREFVKRSGEAWRAADVLAGTDPAAAGDAVRRTIAFYAGNASSG